MSAFPDSENVSAEIRPGGPGGVIDGHHQGRSINSDRLYVFSHRLPDDLRPAGEELAHAMCTIEAQPLGKRLERSIDGPGLGVAPVGGVEAHVASVVTIACPPSAMA